MNKFSKISEQKTQVVDKEKLKLEAIKAGINQLIDNYLSLRYYGSARRNIMENTVKIAGKDLFIEALIDFMNEKSIGEQISTLESLKSETRDWQVIDNKISELTEKIVEEKRFKENSKQIRKIKTLLDTYGDDERFSQILESMVKKTETSNEAYVMAEVANKMRQNFKYLDYSKKHLNMIFEKFSQRSKELTFRENGTNS